MLLNGGLEFLFPIVFVWLGALSYLTYKVSDRYIRLKGESGKEDLASVLGKLSENQTKFGNQIKSLEESLIVQEQKGITGVQRVGLVRFNPFSETGGDQSFALALLNGKDNGVVLLSLHGREGTRVYVKPVKEGESTYELSKEERQAIEEARKAEKQKV
ncbi:MAG: hypothetical protein A3D24_03645 [Candidatus Blackburnbacteria bacterium RIFCSPHIGHO2_02_FULL_39_13]|uniref:DUF4446 domain-containing protein n=1 Tax=Candidatus Blackburnbacteria bacterium RIFCSPLOWO2_01_FULL_40_20 TaxID=1797519 RepID=A0A1G1VF49_9BACT|nr:MAG: hypothetical protein A2694_01245 [Candidatus Blackburnbacteria bacterium RIFCSPHIGHO2_01_FULL_40_17]OGY09996.1 MAG: hypothetical protein A3D24_03645 [Candidatus Blackburnbacteria bacterium RIFCSPHIGHO2_02_FULL_39_13]OGY13842.1 MAG: hypothetical protein A3A77_03635 [Candidatus Blackburnbacteria bacterium RIFCSPLOWO2_01_FULL_40_20]HBL52024.1 hypothetical protein [Candidatus Blackburnbacteria bacterium]